jgi:hypothetical protein
MIVYYTVHSWRKRHLTMLFERRFQPSYYYSYRKRRIFTIIVYDQVWLTWVEKQRKQNIKNISRPMPVRPSTLFRSKTRFLRFLLRSMTKKAWLLCCLSRSVQWPGETVSKFPPYILQDSFHVVFHKKSDLDQTNFDRNISKIPRGPFILGHPIIFSRTELETFGKIYRIWTSKNPKGISLPYTVIGSRKILIIFRGVHVSCSTGCICCSFDFPFHWI